MSPEVDPIHNLELVDGNDDIEDTPRSTVTIEERLQSLTDEERLILDSQYEGFERDKLREAALKIADMSETEKLSEIEADTTGAEAKKSRFRKIMGVVGTATVAIAAGVLYVLITDQNSPSRDDLDKDIESKEDADDELTCLNCGKDIDNFFYCDDDCKQEYLDKEQHYQDTKFDWLNPIQGGRPGCPSCGGSGSCALCENEGYNEFSYAH